MSEKLKAADFTAAMKLRERDMRARVLADSCVAMAMQELRPETEREHDGREYAHRVAQLATALLISGIYIGDEEIRALREEMDALRERCQSLYLTIPPKMSISDITS